jgi:hypothetical protein
MSTPQRNDPCWIPVGPPAADILRTETLVVLEANHHLFEDVGDFGPPAQLALSSVYRDAFAVLDAVGWTPPADPTTVDVPITDGHADQLHRRRYDLGRTTLDRLDTLEHTTDPVERATIQTTIDTERTAAETLDALLAAYHRARAT